SGLLPRGQIRVSGECSQVDVDVADILVPVGPQRTAESPALKRSVKRLLIVRLVVPREVDAFATHGAETPDIVLDPRARAAEAANGGRRQPIPRGIGEQGVEQRLVRVRDVEEVRTRGAREQRTQHGADRGQPAQMQYGGHGQNPAVIEKKTLRSGG